MITSDFASGIIFFIGPRILLRLVAGITYYVDSMQWCFLYKYMYDFFNEVLKRRYITI